MAGGTLWAAELPQVQTWQGSSGGDVRTQISIRSSSKLTPTPVLLIECNRQGANHRAAIGIYLVPGPLKPHPKVGVLNSVSEWLLLTKIDEQRPAWRSWLPVGKTGSYVYQGDGEEGLPSQTIGPKLFIKDLLNSKYLDVEVQRVADRESHVLTFDTSQLKQAFASRQECVSQ